MNNHGLRITFEQFTVSISYSTFRMTAVSLSCHYAQRSHSSGFASEKNETSRKKWHFFRLHVFPEVPPIKFIP